MNRNILTAVALVCVTALYSQPILATKRQLEDDAEAEGANSSQCLRQDSDSLRTIPPATQLSHQQPPYTRYLEDMNIFWFHKIRSMEQQIAQQNQQILQLQQQMGQKDELLANLGIYMNEFDEVTEINLSFTNVTCFPDVLCNLPNLTFLDLGDNEIREPLPESIGKLTKLTRFRYTRNQLEYLPESIGNLKNLEVLQLRENELTGLPQSFEKLINLTELDLRWNELKSVPDCLIKLTKLVDLDLSKNKSIKDTYSEDDFSLCFDPEYDHPDRLRAFLKYDRALKTYNNSLVYARLILNEYSRLHLFLPNDVIDIISWSMNALEVNEINDYYKRSRDSYDYQ